jgi:serine/threonine protein kinase
MPAKPLRIEPGTAIGELVVEGPFARGSMGTVFEARDSLALAVALKLVDEPSTSQRTRLLREARTLMTVEHPGLARVLGAGEHHKWLYFASELVRGKTLRAYIAEEGAVLPARALRWIIEIAEALAAAHAAGVTHGDLDASSIVLTRSDHVKVVGACGPRRKVDPAEDPEDVGHLSPEQVEHGLGDERSDVWSLGCLLYELCEGVPPFGRSGRATLSSILHDDPVMPGGVSASIADLIGGCLRKTSFSRIASMREVASIARDALENPSAPAAVAHAVERASERAARLTSRPPPVAASAPPPSRRRTSIRPPSVLPPPGAPRATSNRPLPSTPVRSSTFPLIDGATRGHIKGTAVRAGVQWFGETYGAAALARVVERASPELKSAIRGDDAALGIIPSSWYDTRVIGELFALFEQVADARDADSHWSAMALAVARDNVQGVYKSLFRLVTTPQQLAANAQRVWRTYCDEGTLSVHEIRAGELRFEIRGWIVHHAHACRALGCILQQTLRAAGYRGLVLERTQCVGDGHAMCAFEGLYLP